MLKISLLFIFLFPAVALAELNQDIQNFLAEMKSESIDLPGRSPLFNHYYESPKHQPDALVIVPGMGEAAIKYYETAKDLKNVLATIYVWDHIGQGTSFHFLPKEKKKIHIDTFDTHINALENFLEQLHKNHRHVFVIAHSMGAHIALRVAVHRPELIQRLVITSPMLDFNHRKVPIHLIAWLLDYLPATYYPSLFTLFKNSKNADAFVTKSEARIKIRKELFAEFPDIERIGPTMGWLNEAVKSMRLFDKVDFSKMKMPILLLQADDDMLVSSTAQVDFCKKVPSCKLQVIKNSRHEILFEEDSPRNEALAAIIPFMKAGAP